MNIVEAIRMSLERTPPELASDILDHGIVLTGGGALLKNLDIRIREETKMAIHVAEDPLSAVVNGCGMVLDNPEKYQKVLVKNKRPL